MNNKKVIKQVDPRMTGIYHHCPECKEQMLVEYKCNYCPNCGQKLGWSVVEVYKKRRLAKEIEERNEPWVLENF